jgi:hypothetical protein
MKQKDYHGDNFSQHQDDSIPYDDICDDDIDYLGHDSLEEWNDFVPMSTDHSNCKTNGKSKVNHGGFSTAGGTRIHQNSGEKSPVSSGISRQVNHPSTNLKTKTLSILSKYAAIEKTSSLMNRHQNKLSTDAKDCTLSAIPLSRSKLWAKLNDKDSIHEQTSPLLQQQQNKSASTPKNISSQITIPSHFLLSSTNHDSIQQSNNLPSRRNGTCNRTSPPPSTTKPSAKDIASEVEILKAELEIIRMKKEELLAKFKKK